jgi:RHS repeat-associated protein
LGITLKVMAGDKIDIHGKSYYFDAHYPGNGNTPIPASDIIYGLFGTALVGSGYSNPHDAADALMGTTTSPALPIANGLLTGQSNDYSNDNTKPKAYINWILFNDQLQYVDGGFSRAGDPGSIKEHYDELQNILMTKNGYLYIYCSNESYEQVFFDNLQVVHTRGQLLEENHYYPFGLTMAGISSRALIDVPTNKKKYNGIDWENDLDIAVYDAQLRELDPQIGRWWEIDPKIESMEMWSPYVSNYDNAIRYSDPLGDEGADCCGFITDILVKLTTNAVKNPDGAAAKTLGITAGIGGSLKGAGENLLNIGAHPVNTLGGLWKLATSSPIENAVNYGLAVSSSYNTGNSTIDQYAAGTHAMTDILMAVAPGIKGVTAGTKVSNGAKVAITTDATGELKSYFGTERAWSEGATPNSIYTQVSSDGKVAVQNSIYNSEGQVVHQVDFKNHGGGATSGHGHVMETPGKIGSGHNHTAGSFVPQEKVPAVYKKIPNGTLPSQQIGK